MKCTPKVRRKTFGVQFNLTQPLLFEREESTYSHKLEKIMAELQHYFTPLQENTSFKRKCRENRRKEPLRTESARFHSASAVRILCEDKRHGFH